MIVNDVSALDRLFWKRAQASILRSPKIRTGVTRAPELRLAARRRGSAEVQVAHMSPLPLALCANVRVEGAYLGRLVHME
jgi:hypothetical protein